jgi:hypothetical protein
VIARTGHAVCSQGLAAVRSARATDKENLMSILVLIVLIILLIGVVPAWPYSRGWGYFPGGLVGILLIVALVLLFTGRL